MTDFSTIRQMTYACFGESQFDKLDQILGNFGE